MFTQSNIRGCNIFSGQFFSSPEPSGSQGELISIPMLRRPLSSSNSWSSTISNISSSETAWPIKAKFHVEPPWERGTKICINGPGHMTKMTHIW